MPPAKLTVVLSAVTPLFLGGAEPNERAETRVPSIKGLLRYWYRAVDGKYQAGESRFFGSSDPKVGQSPCLLRSASWEEGQFEWEGGRVRDRDRDRPGRYTLSPERGGFQRSSPTGPLNGITYLGYSLKLGGNDRKAIPPRARVTVFAQPRPGHDSEALRRAWLAALWLLVHVGGVGSRARRGLGSLRLDQWEGWPECAELALPCQANTPSEWEARLRDGLARLREWFPTQPAVTHTVLGPGARFSIVEAGHQSWEAAADDAGLRLQQFRQRRPPDYEAIKQHLSDGRPLRAAPERAGFGLPLTFRYSSLPGQRPITFQGAIHNGVARDREASPLFIRVVHLGYQYHAVFARMLAPLLAVDRKVRVRGGRADNDLVLSPSGATIVDRFLDERVLCLGANQEHLAREVRW